MVTLFITSCGRVDLLEKTLDSFFAFNTFRIHRCLIVEDSADQNVFSLCVELNKKYDNKLGFIFNQLKLGQTRSIDLGYSQINTPYVFHCEDDWEFYARGFIEKSLMLLESRPEVLQAWIRPRSDGIFNIIAPEVFYTPNGVPFRNVLPGSFYTWQASENCNNLVENYAGFSFNPGLKRIKDYARLGSGGYQQFGKEHLIDQYYRDLGYRFVSMTTNDSDGYVRHIGGSRHCENTVL
jgi:hypothetical protein